MIAAWGIWKVYSIPATRKSRARELDSNLSNSGCLVSTSVDYLETSDDECVHAEELRKTLHDKAANQLESNEVRFIGRLRKPLIFAAATAGGFIMFHQSIPHADIALSRVLLPHRNIPYTSLQVTSGNMTIPKHSDIEIAAIWDGRTPRDAVLEMKPAGADVWSDVQLVCNTNRVLTYNLKALEEDTEYRFRLDDTQSSTYQVHVFSPPSMKNTRITSHPPEYTGKSPGTIETPDISVLRGSRLELEFFCSDSIESAQLEFDDQSTIPLEFENDAWRTTMTLMEDRKYRLALVDREGRKGGNTTPFLLNALPDEKPRIRILDPDTDIRAKADSTIPIKFEAGDDYGISRLELRYKKMGGEEKSIPYPVLDGDTQQFAGTINLDLKPLELRDYEVIYYYLHAEDNNSMDGPGISDTAVYFIEITDKESPLSNCNGKIPRQTFNLLHLEKNVIAQTMAITTDDSVTLSRISKRQQQTLELSYIFEREPILALAPELARFEFMAAQSAMKRAVGHFDQQSRDAALSSAEKALAHLYETIRLLPELEPKMCRGQGPGFKVILQAIEEKKKKEVQDLNKDLQTLIDRAKNIMKLEDDWINRLTEILSPSQQPTTATASSSGGQMNGTRTGSPSGQNFTQQEKTAQSNPGKNEQTTAQLTELSAEQKAMAARMSELARELGDMSHRDERISPLFSEDVKKAAHDFSMSSEETQTNPGHGHGYARRGIMVLAAVIDALEAEQTGGVSPTRVDVQLYPQKYEQMISEYLKGLSFAE